ncbi:MULTISPECIES: hypothetical protein [Pseudomonas]|jgi:hypothetical protein|uniref:hypothetical protein n=1 Tax=Pseudomonas TaxID=286 RepID=UPI000FBD6510|nr:hypothetical protein [Pseudomonas sp. PDM30]MBV7489421.1 hypothetical protein [Pseudomonas sp. PDM30]
MTTDISIKSEANLPEEDVINFADIGDHFNFEDNRGTYRVTSKIFKSNHHTGYFPEQITRKLTLESSQGWPAIEFETPVSLAGRYMHAGDSITTPKGTFKVDHQHFQLRTNGLFFDSVTFSPLNGELDVSSNANATDSESIWVSKTDSIKLAHRSETYYYLEVGTSNPPLYRVTSKELIRHNSDDEQLSFKMTVEAENHPTVELTTPISPSLSILPYATAGDPLIGFDLSNIKVGTKFFLKHPISHLYSVQIIIYS